MHDDGSRRASGSDFRSVCFLLSSHPPVRVFVQPTASRLSRSARGDVEEDEAVENRELPTILNWPESLRPVVLEERHGHLAATDERNGRHRDARRDEEATKEFNDPCGASLGEER